MADSSKSELELFEEKWREIEDEELYSHICFHCEHSGEDHCNPSEGGMCCIGIETKQCPCPGFRAKRTEAISRLEKYMGLPEGHLTKEREKEKETVPDGGRLIEP
jgi:hypothetical protein